MPHPICQTCSEAITKEREASAKARGYDVPSYCSQRCATVAAKRKHYAQNKDRLIAEQTERNQAARAAKKATKKR